MNYECQGGFVRVWPEDFVLSVQSRSFRASRPSGPIMLRGLLPRPSGGGTPGQVNRNTFGALKL